MRLYFGLLFSLIITFLPGHLYSQCFTSPGNPIGGTANMGVLDKKAFRLILFYRHSFSNRYFEGTKKYTDSVLINTANYNYLGNILAYGLTNNISLESELGYFLNKTQLYNTEPEYSSKGYGLSNIIISGKFRLYNNSMKRFEIVTSIGCKIPLATKAQIVSNVELPIELQSTTGSYGLVFQSYLIKESSERGLRFFLINRFETNFENNQNFFLNNKIYKFGNSYQTSLFLSKHLMHPAIKGDWTTILQIRNVINDKTLKNDQPIKASGNCSFYISPQVNYTLKKLWNISILVDIPFYQNYNYIQLAENYAFTLSITRDFARLYQTQY